MASIDVSKYSHSPVHRAIISKDYAGFKRILSNLPKLCDPTEIKTESVSLAEEAKAEAISAVIDRRDVPNRDTPLHLAVKLSDELSADMLMAAGADWTLQNEHGWSALQEAICNKEERIAMTIVRHCQPLAWAKWCRRLPRLVATMGRMRDFYMEITFHFESSVIPFISRVAPSDTYKIWKRGANLRADMTLAGFDGFRIQRSDQSILFLGDGSEDGKIPPGSLCMISHKDKEVMNALDGAASPASEKEVSKEVATMSKTSIFRPGIDVTEAILYPQLTWRRHERTEMVGQWKARVYDMHNVVVSVKSRRVPGAMTDEELFSNPNNENETESEDLDEILTEDERRQLENTLKLASPESSNGITGRRRSCDEYREVQIEDGHECRNGEMRPEKKGWFGGRRRRETKNDEVKNANIQPRSSQYVDEKVNDLLGENSSPGNQIRPGRHSLEAVGLRGRDSKASTSSGPQIQRKDSKKENEYKKGLRPILWLSESFPLRSEELLPLLDILADKVKAIRRLRELLTTKLPSGTFPVKVAIPVIPTIRVLVTFTKFEELQPVDEFVTPPTSPNASIHDTPGEVATQGSNSSWFQWIKTPYEHPSSGKGDSSSGKIETIQDPFVIPSGYNWITAEEKKKKMQEKNRLKKGKNKTH